MYECVTTKNQVSSLIGIIEFIKLIWFLSWWVLEYYTVASIKRSHQSREAESTREDVGAWRCSQILNRNQQEKTAKYENTNHWRNKIT